MVYIQGSAITYVLQCEDKMFMSPSGSQSVVPRPVQQHHDITSKFVWNAHSLDPPLLNQRGVGPTNLYLHKLSK